MSFEKIKKHPDYKLIVRKLTKGEGVRKVSNFLKEKYPKDKSKHVSFVTLQKFRNEKLKIEGEALELIKQETQEKIEKKEDRAIKRMPAYKEKVKEIVDYHVDIQNEIKELLILAKARLEDLFDRAANGELTISEEKNLLTYFQIITATIEKWAKYVEKIADRTVETNVNITVIEDQMSHMRSAVYETIKEMEPNLAINFLNKLNIKLEEASYQKENISFDQIKDEAKLLTTKVEELE